MLPGDKGVIPKMSVKEASDHLEGMMNLLDGINADDQAALAVLSDLAEECERLKRPIGFHDVDEFYPEEREPTMDEWKDRAEKAEAELEKVKDNLGMMTKNRDYWLEKTQGAKAKLARFAPLIEAANARERTPDNCRFYWWDFSADVVEGCKVGQTQCASPVCPYWEPRTRWQRFRDKVTP